MQTYQKRLVLNGWLTWEADMKKIAALLRTMWEQASCFYTSLSLDDITWEGDDPKIDEATQWASTNQTEMSSESYILAVLYSLNHEAHARWGDFIDRITSLLTENMRVIQ